MFSTVEPYLSSHQQYHNFHFGHKKTDDKNFHFLLWHHSEMQIQSHFRHAKIPAEPMISYFIYHSKNPIEISDDDQMIHVCTIFKCMSVQFNCSEQKQPSALEQYQPFICGGNNGTTLHVIRCSSTLAMTRSMRFPRWWWSWKTNTRHCAAKATHAPWNSGKFSAANYVQVDQNWSHQPEVCPSGRPFVRTSLFSTEQAHRRADHPSHRHHHGRRGGPDVPGAVQAGAAPQEDRLLQDGLLRSGHAEFRVVQAAAGPLFPSE